MTPMVECRLPEAPIATGEAYQDWNGRIPDDAQFSISEAATYLGINIYRLNDAIAELHLPTRAGKRGSRYLEVRQMPLLYRNYFSNRVVYNDEKGFVVKAGLPNCNRFLRFYIEQE